MMSKLNLEALTEDEKVKLKEYINSVKEIKKEIKKLVRKARPNKMQEEGGDQSSGLELNL